MQFLSFGFSIRYKVSTLLQMDWVIMAGINGPIHCQSTPTDTEAFRLKREWTENSREGQRKKDQQLKIRGTNYLLVQVWRRGSEIYNLLQTSETYSCTHVRTYSSRISDPCSLRSLKSMQIPDLLLAVGKRGCFFKLKTAHCALTVDRMSAIHGQTPFIKRVIKREVLESVNGG